MGLIFKFIFLILLVNSIENTIQHYGSSRCKRNNIEHQVVEVSMYSRHNAKYKTWYATNETDNPADQELPDEKARNNGLLKYGHSYENIGKISTPQECARTCTKTSLPKNCYYKFTIEYYKTLSGACDLCRPTTNTSLTSDCQCIEADGIEVAGIMVINRMLPGPSIQVCLGDLVIVDVVNETPGAGVTIHWHGIYQKDWQYYDGTSYVTQCPINEGETFRYKWRAQNVGTHLYYAQTGFHKSDGVEGTIVIRSPIDETLNKYFYDEDGFDNVIMIKDWFHNTAQNYWPGSKFRSAGQSPDNILINGKGQWFNSTSGLYTDTPLAVFNVQKNRRYRFRMINSLDWPCGTHLTIENHNLILIAADGDDVEPLTVTTIGSSAGERYDFVLDTHNRVGTYWIQVRLFGGACNGSNLSQVAILRYIESEDGIPKNPRPSYLWGLPTGIIFNDWNAPCNGQNPYGVCIQDLRSTESVNPRIFTDNPDMTLFLPYKLYSIEEKNSFLPNIHKTLGGTSPFIGAISGISNIFPTSPYLTQYNGINLNKTCNDQKMPETCNGINLGEEPCSCSHVIDVPLNSVVEIIALHEGETSISHPFHLHGYGFHVMAQGSLNDIGLTKKTKYIALPFHRQFYRKFYNRPPVKDTIPIAASGYAIVRFIADNPGSWLFRSQIQQHLLVGMSLVFRVGNETDLPTKPKHFPRCGSFTRL